MKTYLLITFSLTSFFASAQLQQVNNGSIDDLVFFVSTNTKIYDKEAKGSRYLNEEFIPARINTIKEVQLIRFNAVENTIELKDSKDKILILSKSYDYSIKLLDGSNKLYETHSYIDEDGAKAISFFEKIYTTEKYALYLKERIIYKPGKKATSSYEQDLPGKFKKGNTIFYVTDLNPKNTGLIAVSKKKKTLSVLFQKQAKTIDKFIKKEGLKMDKKEDIISILNFYFEKE